MLDEHALRYLLSRQIWVLRNSVAPNILEEITSSLEVRREGRDFAISWMRDGKPEAKTIPRSEFAFYRRGDRAESEGVVGDFEASNAQRARELAAEIVGLDLREGLFDRPAASISIHDVLAFSWGIVLCGALVFVGPQMERFAIILVAGLSLEFIPRYGRMLSAITLLAFPLLGFAFSGLVAAILYGLAQALDPDSRQRTFRIVLCAPAFVLSLTKLNFAEVTPQIALIAFGLFCFVTLIDIFRWTLGLHRRVYPLVVPYFSVSLALAGQLAASAVIAVFSIVSLLAKAYGWKILPHPNATTYQGISKTTRQ